MKREISDAPSQSVVTARKSAVPAPIKRRYPIGAEIIGPNQTHFRVWAPKAKRLDVVLEESSARNAARSFHALTREKTGYFSGSAPAGSGALYRFRVDQQEAFPSRSGFALSTRRPARLIVRDRSD